MNWKMLLCEERMRPSRNPGGPRTEFERDYDRAVFSTPVRRLQDKAQVFPLEPHDAVRTRLTHSLEVSTLARDVAGEAARWMLEQKYLDSHEQVRNVQTIAATCGLLHDLGNPPFGHAGEKAISTWVDSHRDKVLREFTSEVMGTQYEQYRGDFLKFEGNAQTLRIVSKLQVLSDFFGLNLTKGTLSALCKYTAPSNEAGVGSAHQESKPGFFASEESVVKETREKCGTGESRNPITYLVEACDDIAYSTVDIEDAIKKGVMDWRTVESELRNGFDTLLKEETPSGVNISSNSLDQCIQTARQIAGSAGQTISQMENDVMGQAFRVAAINAIVPSVLQAFQKNYQAIWEAPISMSSFRTAHSLHLFRPARRLVG